MFTDFEKVSMFFRNNYVPYLRNGHWVGAIWEYTQGLPWFDFARHYKTDGGIKVNSKTVPKDKKIVLRKKFIERFVDTKTEHYKAYIETLKEYPYPDGMCYEGYDSFTRPGLSEDDYIRICFIYD